MTLHSSQVPHRNDERKSSRHSSCSNYQFCCEYSRLLCEAVTKYEIKLQKFNKHFFYFFEMYFILNEYNVT